MGRTVLAYSIQLEILEKRLSSFRRGLRKEDQHIFDDILRWGKNQVQSGVLASSANPSDPVFWSAFIEIKRALDAHSRELEHFREKINSSNNSNDSHSCLSKDESVSNISESNDSHNCLSKDEIVSNISESNDSHDCLSKDKSVSNISESNDSHNYPSKDESPVERLEVEKPALNSKLDSDSKFKSDLKPEYTEELLAEQDARLEILKEEVSEIRSKVKQMGELMQTLYRDFETFRRLSKKWTTFDE